MFLWKTLTLSSPIIYIGKRSKVNSRTLPCYLHTGRMAHAADELLEEASSSVTGLLRFCPERERQFPAMLSVVQECHLTYDLNCLLDKVFCTSSIQYL